MSHSVAVKRFKQKNINVSFSVVSRCMCRRLQNAVALGPLGLVRVALCPFGQVKGSSRRLSSTAL